MSTPSLSDCSRHVSESQPTPAWNAPATPCPWVEVLVDCPGAQGLFTYQLPPSLPVQVGDILSVPFGAQQVGAIALRLLSQLAAGLEPDKLRPVEAVIARGFFPVGYWPLLERVAQYYHTPLIQVMRVALPPGLLQRSQRRVRLNPQTISPEATASLGVTARQVLALLQASATGDYTWGYLQQKVAGMQGGLRELQRQGWVETYLKPPTPPQPKRRQVAVLLSMVDPDLTPRQQEILAYLKQRGGELWVQELLQGCRTSSSTLKGLAQKGCLILEHRQVLRRETSPTPIASPPPRLTADQIAALKTIHTLSGFSQVLLHGVTGSGKTEVYLQAIAPVLQRGQSVLVLVPEIGLTPQLTDRFRSRFGARVWVYHSGLSDGERYDTWRQLLQGTAQVMIGTRSAVFAPLPNLGLIILDEEHDRGFKQDRPLPCYHARTVATWRADLANCPLILGSATPCLETWASLGSAPHYLSLPQRVQARPLPLIEVVDMRRELQEGNRGMFSRTLAAALAQLQAQQQQGLLFVHRRGHSTFVSCRSCGYVVECPNCSVALTYHHTQEGDQPLLRCHYCNYTRLHPPHCPTCQSPYFKFFGSGTQRVMRELREQFPQLRLIRFDSDTTRAKGAHRRLLDRFAQGEADLLVGTQMLTKGLDLSQVKLVGVLAADGLLNLPDFRASERAFQTLTQVAGRSGRGDEPGRVILQTYTPEHPVIEAVQNYQQEGFVTAELQERASLNYPPYGQLILLRLSGLDQGLVVETAQGIAEFIRTYHQTEALPWELLGPAPANILRVARRYRWQLLLKLPPNPSAIPTFRLPVEQLQALCPSSVRLTIDVDPLSLLA